jgi:hypothetical protein
MITVDLLLLGQWLDRQGIIPEVVVPIHLLIPFRRAYLPISFLASSPRKASPGFGQGAFLCLHTRIPDGCTLGDHSAISFRSLKDSTLLGPS